MASEMTPEQIVKFIQIRRLPLGDEKKAQWALAAEFDASGIAYEREVDLGGGDIIDFMVGDTAIEMKIKEQRRAIYRQCERYCSHDRVKALVLATKYSNIAGWSDIAATGIFKSVVFDEMQELRHGVATAKGMAAKVFSDYARVRIGLTASPVYGYASEIFNIVDMLAPGALGTWHEFIREWCSTQTGGGKWIVDDPDALGTYLRELQLVVRRLRQGRRINKLTIEVEHDEQVEQDSLALARKLAIKVTTGSFTERGQAARELDMYARMITGVSKAKAVAAYARVILKSGKPVIIGLWHRDVYSVILEELSEFNPVMYTGSETAKQKDAAKYAFIEGRTDCMLLSLRSGLGIDGLQKRCSTFIFGEFDWSPAVADQSLGRIDRPGQPEDEITAIYLWTNSGSDPLIMEMLGLKASQARGVVDPMRGVEAVFSDESRIRQLAERYLQAA